MVRTLVTFLAAAIIPSVASAQVVISEIMYDVEGTDTDREWVELYNGGSEEIDITGWKINDGSNHVLNEPGKNGSIGTMTITGGGYLVLAADAPTFMAAYPSIPNVIDTVLSLNNTGDTISLINAEGTTVDSIAYTKETGAAGDGNTLHRGSGGSALTPGAPSPGSGAIQPVVSSDSSSGAANSSSSGSSSSNSSGSGTAQKSESNSSAAPKLTVSAGNDKTVVAGASVLFEADAYDSEKKRIENTSFIWSFGDGGKGVDGSRVQHEFVYPGRYVVVLDAAYQGENASARVTVEAIAADIALLVFSDGGVSVENRGRIELDLSGWRLRDQGKTYTVPTNTIVLPGAALRLSSQTLGFFVGGQAELLSPNEAIIFHPGETKQETAPAQSPAPTPKVIDEEKESPKPATRAAKEAEDVQVVESVETVQDEDQEKKKEAQVAAAGSFFEGGALWWGGALLIAILGGGAAFAARRMGNKEWNIIEETGEEV